MTYILVYFGIGLILMLVTIVFDPRCVQVKNGVEVVTDDVWFIFFMWPVLSILLAKICWKYVSMWLVKLNISYMKSRRGE